MLNFQVIRDYNGKPIRNASVVMHPVQKNGKQSKGGLQIKTDAEGKASFDGAPYGKLRVQVLAQGFQTFGADYDVDKPTLEIMVKMKRPAGQYSIYEDHPGDKKDDKGRRSPIRKISRSRGDCRLRIVDFRLKIALSGFAGLKYKISNLIRQTEFPYGLFTEDRADRLFICRFATRQEHGMGWCNQSRWR